MNSSFVRTMVFAALLGAPLAGFGQIMHTQAGGPRTESLTLLTGPSLTSTPSGTSVGAVGLAQKDLERIDDEIRAANERLEEAAQKLKRLQSERALALARKNALEAKRAQAPIGGLGQKGGIDWLNYNFRAPPALWPQPTQAAAVRRRDPPVRDRR